ncbi:hypothetical protein PG989_010282 [Apiospora arundinis]|uniref:Uncharacterized protein n=1 Tax=Apiospora arundinis TaxID=335852 RepID=A0ABR2JBV6_9PEZI
MHCMQCLLPLSLFLEYQLPNTNAKADEAWAILDLHTLYVWAERYFDWLKELQSRALVYRHTLLVGVAYHPQTLPPPSPADC